MSLLPLQFPDALVAIGTFNDKREFVADSTGFVVGYETGERNENNEQVYEIYLVTNRHVFEKRDKVVLRFNRGDADSHQFDLDLKNYEGSIWTAHSNPIIDIAVVILPVKILEAKGITPIWFTPDLILLKKGIEDEAVRMGDDVYVLGFPMGIAGIKKNFPIVRSGIIARLDKEILEDEHCFYIDSAVYGGNSGGPVILRPSIFSSTGTKPVNTAYVLGVISSVKLDKSSLYGIKNGQFEERMVLYENSHLVTVIPMDYVKESVAFLKARLSQLTIEASKTEIKPELNNI